MLCNVFCSILLSISIMDRKAGDWLRKSYLITSKQKKTYYYLKVLNHFVNCIDLYFLFIVLISSFNF